MGINGKRMKKMILMENYLKQQKLYEEGKWSIWGIYKDRPAEFLLYGHRRLPHEQ